MYRRVFMAAVATAALVLTTPACYGAELIDRLVAVVNDEPILLSELNREFKPYVERIEQAGYPMEKQRQLLFKARADILNQLVNRKLTDQEIARHGIRVSDEEIDATIERIKEAAFSTEEAMRSALEAEGMSMEEYRKRVRQQVLRRKLINAEVRSKIVITKEDIRAYYDDHPDLFGGEMQYHLKNILMKVPPGADEDRRHGIRLQMEGLYQALTRGRPFDDLMKAVEDQSTQAASADLGLFAFDSLSPQLQEALRDKKAGSFSGVMENDMGFQIIYLEEIVQSNGKPLEEVSASIEEKLFNEIVDKKFDSWLEKLRSRSNIKLIQ